MDDTGKELRLRNPNPEFHPVDAKITMWPSYIYVAFQIPRREICDSFFSLKLVCKEARDENLR